MDLRTFTVRFDATRIDGRRIPGGKYTYPLSSYNAFEEP